MVKVFVIAEAGVNHNGKWSLAKKLVDAAVNAGADAVKFQTFKAEGLVAAKAPKAEYQKKSGAKGESQQMMLKRLELSEENHKLLKKYCASKKIIFMSTPFDESCADLLRSQGMGIYKIPSGEITNLNFLRHVASFKKPIILSTGMSTLAEVKTAVETIYKAGNKQLTLLHCVSNYPADVSQVNLKAMQTLASEFNVPVGYSDHTLGIDIPVAAVALGAVVIEKHLTLNKKLPGPDQAMSLDPLEFKRMIDSIRRTSQALGTGEKTPTKAEAAIAKVARKSLVAAMDIPKGEAIVASMICVKRPGTGIAPTLLNKAIGLRAKRLIKCDELLSWRDLK